MSHSTRQIGTVIIKHFVLHLTSSPKPEQSSIAVPISHFDLLSISETILTSTRVHRHETAQLQCGRQEPIHNLQHLKFSICPSLANSESLLPQSMLHFISPILPMSHQSRDMLIKQHHQPGIFISYPPFDFLSMIKLFSLRQLLESLRSPLRRYPFITDIQAVISDSPGF